MEFLLQYNLKKDEVDEIVNNNCTNVINNIVLNKRNVISIVEYLLELGITLDTLRDLFINQIGIFFRTRAELERVFEEYEIDSIVKSLNYDVNTLDLIEF
ncbi:MAG: hypothetical protein MJ232_00845 [archaeon]|nr:hypothetical protein [archaeon]